MRACSRNLFLKAVLLVTALCAQGSETNVILRGPERQRLEEALACLDLTLPDAGFEKDVAQPRLVLPAVRALLGDPLGVTAMGSAALEASGSLTGMLVRAGAWLGVEDFTKAPGRRHAPGPVPEGVAPELAAAVQAFADEVARAVAELETAWGGLDPATRVWLAATHVGGVFNIEENAGAWQVLREAGVPEAALQAAVAESHELDAGPFSKRFLDSAAAVRMDRLLDAGARVAAAAEALSGRCAGIREWPAAPLEWVTAAGTVRIGTPGADTHESGSPVLVLDPGGDDVYRGGAGAANGLEGRPVAVIVDRGGDDRYAGSALCAAGCGLFGVGVVIDEGGEDAYRAAWMGQGSGVFGVGIVLDRGGCDQYSAQALAQGAGVVGLGLLRDVAGHDAYRVAINGQGYGGVRGVGWLSDAAGNDRYDAGGVEVDHERHEHRYLSMAQGFGIGMRPAGGGGVGVLFDGAGNDVYRADVYGQGVGYWYALGMLLDAAGHDSYELYEYGQGSGIHLSAGLLFDGAGQDVYTGFSLAQGSAHDYAVGVLIDREGDDTYTADHYAQGRAINNAFALLLDGAGRDAYFARNDAESQGKGNYNAERGYGSLSMLVDLGGADRYSGGARDGARLTSPDDGILFDLQEDPPATAAGPAGVGPAATFDAANADFDTLMFHAARRADTPEKKGNKAAGRQELKARGAAALRYLVSHVWMENDWFYIYARELVDELPDDEAAAVLLELAGADAPADVRKVAVLLLGSVDTPEHAAAIRPLLGDETLGGVAVRTLGKWRDAESVPRIIPYLRDPIERRRIQAAVALGEIGDVSAVPALREALGDGFFMVRRAAARALAAIEGAAAPPPL